MAFNIPIIYFKEWDINEPFSPVGRRHTFGGTGFVKLLASGCQEADPMLPSSSSGTLIFKNTKFDIINGIPSPHVASQVHPLTINLGSSGVGITNMRLYLRDNSALRASVDQGLDPAFVQMAVSGAWHYRALLPSGATTRLSTTVPSFPNIFRQDGAAGLEGQDDVNSSQFVYLNLILPFGSPLGTFGICGSGDLRFGLQFDYFPI